MVKEKWHWWYLSLSSTPVICYKCSLKAGLPMNHIQQGVCSVCFSKGYVFSDAGAANSPGREESAPASLATVSQKDSIGKVEYSCYDVSTQTPTP